MLGAYIFLLAIFLGVELIGRVPATLHTPLMSGTNAIHGIVLLGGMIVLGQADPWWLKIIGILAVVLGAANVFGGFVVTDRMLEMFKRKPAAGSGAEEMIDNWRDAIVDVAYFASAILFILGLKFTRLAHHAPGAATRSPRSAWVLAIVATLISRELRVTHDGVDRGQFDQLRLHHRRASSSARSSPASPHGG